MCCRLFQLRLSTCKVVENVSTNGMSLHLCLLEHSDRLSFVVVSGDSVYSPVAKGALSVEDLGKPLIWTPFKSPCEREPLLAYAKQMLVWPILETSEKGFGFRHCQSSAAKENLNASFSACVPTDECASWDVAAIVISSDRRCVRVCVCRSIHPSTHYISCRNLVKRLSKIRIIFGCFFNHGHLWIRVMPVNYRFIVSYIRDGAGWTKYVATSAVLPRHSNPQGQRASQGYTLWCLCYFFCSSS